MCQDMEEAREMERDVIAMDLRIEAERAARQDGNDVLWAKLHDLADRYQRGDHVKK